PRLVVDPGVDDPAVARRSPHAQTRRRFEQEHVVIVARDFGGDGCSDDSAADDGYVSDVRWAHCLRFGQAKQIYWVASGVEASQPDNNVGANKVENRVREFSQ